MESGTPYFVIMGQGHPDITNKVEKDVKSNQSINQTNFYNKTVGLKMLGFVVYICVHFFSLV